MRQAAYCSISLSFFLLATFAYASHPSILCPQFTRLVAFGSRGEDIKALQVFLSGDSAIYPERLATGYFGKLTEEAVKRFQARHGIVSSGSPAATGYGVFGPRTRSKLKDICEKMNFSHEEVVPAPPTLPSLPAQPTIPETTITPTPPLPTPLPPAPAPPTAPIPIIGAYEGTTCILDVEPKVSILGRDRPEATWTVNSSPTGWHFYFHDIVDGKDLGDAYGGATNRSKLETYTAVPAKHTRYAHVVIEQNHLVGASHSDTVCTTNTATIEIK